MPGAAGLCALYVLAVIAALPHLFYPFGDSALDAPGFVAAQVGGAEVIVAAAQAGAPAVLVLPGNTASVAATGPVLARYRQAGFEVIALRYRGSDGVEGRPTEAALKADAQAVIDVLADEGRAVVLHGVSLGAGLALWLAGQGDPVAVVLDAPFARGCEIVARTAGIPACHLPGPRWDSLAAAADVHAPVLIRHGGADQTIPAADSARLAERLRATGSPVARVVVPSGTHDDLLLNPEADEALSAFIDRVLAGQP